MQASHRIVVNTIVQYMRTILNMLLSLYSARLVLNILGVNDYGIYSLVGGVVSMLSFLTNSLVGSTQRFLSICRGKGNIEQLKVLFSNSVLLHVIIGSIILIILEALTGWLFGGFLNISPNREHAAAITYQIVVFMVYISFISAPYKALLVSRENIVYISIIELFDGIAKVVLVLILRYITYDKLIAYSWIMFGISTFNLIALISFPAIKYEECIFPKVQYLTKKYIVELSQFTGWITYSSVCIALRNQGVSIVLNKFRNTAINAAYGIGMQITGMVSFVSTSLSNAIAPQMMVAEGGNDRHRVIQLAEMQCKFSYLLMALVGIPTMFEMTSILKLWLGQVPDYSVQFGCMFIAMQIIDMLTTGLGIANRAIGNIGKYIFITCSPKLLVLPISWLMLKNRCEIWTICALMIAVELICTYLRIPLLKHENGFNEKTFFMNSIKPIILPTLIAVCSCSIIQLLPSYNWRSLITFLISSILFIFSAYHFSLTKTEKVKITDMVNRITKRR